MLWRLILPTCMIITGCTFTPQSTNFAASEYVEPKVSRGQSYSTISSQTCQGSGCVISLRKLDNKRVRKYSAGKRAIKVAPGAHILEAVCSNTIENKKNITEHILKVHVEGGWAYELFNVSDENEQCALGYRRVGKNS